MTVPGPHSHVRGQIGHLYTLPAVLALLFPWAAQAAMAATQQQPIQLHPENPHYFLWRGKPTVLVASTEHYGMESPSSGSATRPSRTAIRRALWSRPARIGRQEIADRLVVALDDPAVRTHYAQAMSPPVWRKAGDHEGCTEDHIDVVGASRVSDRIHRLLRVLVRRSHGGTQRISGLWT